MACPLCGHSRSSISWVGATCYLGREFPYVECVSCRSLYCHPMPEERILSLMYGADYSTSFAADAGIDDPKQPERVVELLKRLPAGVFVDYGCGQGALLRAARSLNWAAIGFEFDREVAGQVANLTGARVLVPGAAADFEPMADVLHLGDVIEHLTDLDHQFPTILKLIKDGGLLVAQGPLENNDCLFTSVVRWARSLRGRPRGEMAPYHVLLATAKGQRVLFQRFGLEELEYSLTEVSWPAPDRRFVSDYKRPRSVALFCLRRLSQMASASRPDRWGNRYFCVGRWSGEIAEP
jgi:SAM-dependent methyltransferase